MRCRRGAGISRSGGYRRTASFSLLLGEMLFRLKTLGCTKIVQTKCDSVETIENIESGFGGASRDRTDGLVVANDGVRRNHLIDSIRASSFFSTEMTRLLEQQWNRVAVGQTPKASRSLAAAPSTRSARRCPSWLKCGSAAFDPGRILGRHRPALAKLRGKCAGSAS